MPISEARLKILIRSISSQIPKVTKDFYRSENHRRLLAAKFTAEKAFLDSQNLKFCLIDPKTGAYTVNLCFLAIIKAMWNLHRPTKLPKSYYEDMLDRGIELFKSIGGRDKMTVTLPNNFDFNDLT